MAEQPTGVPQQEAELERMRQAQEQGTDSDSPATGTNRDDDNTDDASKGVSPDRPEEITNAGEM